VKREKVLQAVSTDIQLALKVALALLEELDVLSGKIGGLKEDAGFCLNRQTNVLRQGS
jgi:hypothetical protein